MVHSVERLNKDKDMSRAVRHARTYNHSSTGQVANVLYTPSPRQAAGHKIRGLARCPSIAAGGPRQNPREEERRLSQGSRHVHSGWRRLLLKRLRLLLLRLLLLTQLCVLLLLGFCGQLSERRCSGNHERLPGRSRLCPREHFRQCGLWCRNLWRWQT